MISALIAEFVRDRLKDEFAAFAYWLFYSEIFVASLLLFLSLRNTDGTEVVIGLFYISFTFVASRNYTRRRLETDQISWSPTSWDRAAASYMYLNILLLGAAVGILASVEWEPNLAYFAMLIGGSSVVVGSAICIAKLLKGEWINWP